MPMSSTVQSTAAPGKSLPPELHKALSHVTEISSLPEVTAKIVQVVEDPRATARDIHDIVRTDPALASKVLKIVNSAFYGLPSQIGSLDRAILMLGLSAIKNLALASSLSRLIKPGPICAQFETRDVWLHCISVGVCARSLAIASHSVPPDEAFVAGLVHDIGLIVSQQLFPAKMREVAESCYVTPQSYCASEATFIGADHQTFGGALAAKWKFPPALRSAIAYHHEPSSLQAEFQKIAAVVYLADALCAQARFGFWLTAQTQGPEEWMLALTGVTLSHLDEIKQAMPAQLDEAEQIFTAN